MKKLTANQVVNQSIFEVITDPVNHYAFAWEKGQNLITSAITPYTGVQLRVVKEPYHDNNGSQLIDFVFVANPATVYSSNWSTFKKCTEYVSGGIHTNNQLVVHSNGLFNGFDVKRSQVLIEPDDEFFPDDAITCNELKIRIVFIGEFVGPKQVNTQIINLVKSSRGFQEHLTKLLTDVFEEKHDEIQQHLKPLLDSSCKSHHLLNNKPYMYTQYHAGRVQFVMNLRGDVDVIKSSIPELVSKFIASKTTYVEIIAKP